MPAASVTAVRVGPIGRLGRWTAAPLPARRDRLGGRRRRSRRARAEGRARALGRRLGGHRLGVRARRARRSIATFAGHCRLRPDGRRALDGKTSATRRSATVAEATQRILEADSARVDGRPAAPGSRSRRTATPRSSRRGAAREPNRMVRAADDLKGEAARPLAGRRRAGRAHRRAGHVVGLQRGQPSAMMKSELISWPVTLAILHARVRLAGRGRPAADAHDPRADGLGGDRSTSSTQLLDISIWAMNFALMFALALGIDYALFIVDRFRGAHFGSEAPTRDAVATTMDTAGKAVLFCGVTVLISLSAVMLVPSPAFRSMALGIMLVGRLHPAATLTLLPAVLARLGARVDKLALPWVAFRRAPLAALRAPGASGCGAARRSTASPALAVLLLAGRARFFGLETGMPSIKVVPKSDGSRVGYAQVQQAFGPGAPGALQVVAPGPTPPASTAVASADPGIARVMPRSARRGGRRSCRSSRSRPVRSRPSAPRSTGCAQRSRRRPRRRRGRREPRPRDTRLAAKTPLVIGVVLGARLPAAAGRPAGADHRRGRRAHEPARHRRGVRRRAADLPGRPPRRACSASSRRASSTPGGRCSSSR